MTRRYLTPGGTRGLTGAADRPTRARRARLLDPEDRLRLAPVALQLVEVPFGRREDVDDDRAEVDQDPVRRRGALPADGPNALLPEAFDDPVRDGRQLALRPARADDEVVAERRQAGEVEQAEVGG